MSAEDEATEVTILVDDEHVADLERVAGACREAGLEVDEVLNDIGVITGRIDPARTRELEDVEGVSAVERSRGYQLAPPDSEVQ